MAVAIEDKGACVKTLTITISKEDVEKEYEKLYHEFKSDIMIPGFRKGKFPRKLFERKYADTIKDDVKGRIKENYLKEALEKESIESLIKPEIDEKEFVRGEPFEFTARVEVKPRFDIPDIKEITLTKEEMVVTDEMIDEQVNYTRERAGKFKPKKGTVKEGDKVDISYEVIVNGEAVDTTEDFSMLAEKGGAFLGEVENYPKVIIGKKKGDKVTLKTKLPVYFKKKEFQGKEAEINAIIKSVEEKELPDADDKDFLSHAGFDSVEDMRTKIKEDLENEIKRFHESSFSGQIYDCLDKNTDFEVPPTMLKGEIESRKKSLVTRLKSQKKDDKEIDKELEDKQEEVEKSALKAIKNFFILEKIAGDKKILVTEQEVDQRINQLALQQRVTMGDMKEHLKRTGGIDAIRGQIREEKTLAYIIEHARVETVAKKEDKKAGKKPKKKTAKKSSKKASGKTSEKKTGAKNSKKEKK